MLLAEIPPIILLNVKPIYKYALLQYETYLIYFDSGLKLVKVNCVICSPAWISS